MEHHIQHVRKIQDMLRKPNIANMGAELNMSPNEIMIAVQGNGDSFMPVLTSNTREYKACKCWREWLIKSTHHAMKQQLKLR